MPYVPPIIRTAAEILFTPAGDIAAADVQAAIAELDTEKVPYSGASGAVDLGAQDFTLSGAISVAADNSKLSLGMGGAGVDWDMYWDGSSPRMDINGNRFMSTEGTANLLWGEDAVGGTNDLGQYNVFLGFEAAYNNKHDAGSSGYYNIYIGYHSGGRYSTNYGESNVGLGANTLSSNTTGKNNMALGYAALDKNTTGQGNVGIGYGVGSKNQDGDNNVLIGMQTGAGVTGNSYSYNVFIGGHTGQLITTGSSNIFLGYYAGYRQTTLSNRLIIDNRLRADPATEATNAILYGVMAATPAAQDLYVNADLFLGVGNNLVLPKASGIGIKVDTTAPTFGWRDLRAEIRTRGGGASDPSDTTYQGNIKAYSFLENDEAWIEFHIPHDYVAGTDIHLHFHWSHNSALVTGGTVTWAADVSYAKGHDQAAFSATVNPTLSPNASTIQYRHMVSEVQISAGTPAGTQIDTDDLEPDGIIIARVYLSSNDITSSGAVPDPFLHEVDVHYQSTNIATKANAPDFYA